MLASIAPLAPLWILVVFALIGVLAGLAQTLADRWCPYCKLQVNWNASKCPHCKCHLD